MIDVNEIEKQAEKELAEEEYLQLVEEKKKEILERRNRSLWQKLFPFKITFKIERL